MSNIAVIMPVIGAVGAIAVISVMLIVNGLVKRARIKSADISNLSRFAEEMRHENAEIKKDLQIVKEKVDAIDKMMKDI